MPDGRLHTMIHGVVQGVGFRYFVIRRAKGLGLTGWVRNVGHDRVETVAEGSRDALNAFLDELKKGPVSAHVRKVDVQWQPYSGEFKSFDVTYEEW
jgi:acylphosphatase